MSTEAQAQSATTTEESTQQTEVVVVKNPYEDSSWSETPITEVKKEEEKVETTVEEKKEEVAIETKIEEAKPEFDWKGTFGYENADQVKAEFEKLKAQPKTEEIKFTNEESKKLFEAIKDGKEDVVLDILLNKKKINDYTSAEINEKNAPEVIKWHLQKKHGDLTQDEVEFLYNQKYSVPEKPQQEAIEEDDDYALRVAAWERQVQLKKKELVIDAKLVRPELEKLKSELILPDIKRAEPPTEKQRSQEELDAEKRYVESFLQNATKAVEDFTGFSATVKDKDVEIPLTYGLSKEQKDGLVSMVNVFAESGLNANAILADRWLKEDKSINVAQMVKDLSAMHYGDIASQKFAAEAANQRLEAYLKEKKNINVNETKQSGTFAPNKDEKAENEKMADHFFSN